MLGRRQAVYLKDIWPTQAEVAAAIERAVSSEGFRKEYAHSLSKAMPTGRASASPPATSTSGSPTRPTSARRPTSTASPRRPRPSTDILGARVLAVLGDSVTTDHISPAGNIKANGPAGKYLADHGVKPADFNSYGSRRGNHEVMVRGTFANVRLRNKLAPGTEGGVTRLLPEGEQMSIFDASVKYAERGVPLIILAGKEYGSGSSRDWAAKGPKLLGVRAVIAESFERIHRSNLVGMGILAAAVSRQARMSHPSASPEKRSFTSLVHSPAKGEVRQRQHAARRSHRERRQGEGI